MFLFLENKGLNTPFGSVFISDENGRSFALSLENVIKGSAVDFERVTSLDGTFIANKYSPNMITRMNRGYGDHYGHMDDWSDEDESQNWTEADMIAEEARQASNSRMGGRANMNAKQHETED